MLGEPAWGAMFDRMAELDVLNAIHPALPWNDAARQRIAAGREMTIPESWLPRPGRQEEHPLLPATIYLSWLIELPQEQAASVSSRLRLPGWMSDRLQAAIKLRQDLDQITSLSPSQTVALLDELPCLALLVCFHLTGSTELKEKITTYFEKWQKVQPKTSGYDLRNHGVPPGPLYRQILSTLRAGWLDGKITTLKEEQTLLKELLAELPPEEDD